MWAPADIFTPTVNAVALALKRATTLAWDNLLFVLIVVAVFVGAAAVIGQIRRKPRT